MAATRTPTSGASIAGVVDARTHGNALLSQVVAVAFGIELIHNSTLSTPGGPRGRCRCCLEVRLGRWIRAAFGKSGQVGFKGAVNPVTETDVAAERVIHSRGCVPHSPDYRIFGEELGEDRAELQRGGDTRVAC